MSKELEVKKKLDIIMDLTPMQKKFVDYLVTFQGRTTKTKAALEAGYAEKYATQQAHILWNNPKVRRYYTFKEAEMNRSLVVTKENYVRHQQVLSGMLVDQNKIKDASVYESHIGKATGQFSETNYNVNINASDLKEKEREIKNFLTNSTFKSIGIFKNSSGVNLKAELNNKFDSSDEVKLFLQKNINSKSW